MSRKQANLVSLAFVVASFALVAWFYARLPDPYPTHWGLHGEANQWVAKPWGPFVLPLVAAGVWLLLAVLPAISPRGYRIEKFGPSFARMLVLINGFFTALNGVVVAQALGAHLGMGRVLLLLTGALLVGVGNYLGKTTPNFFVGVRTPWTLASPVVWERTHRLAAWLFVATGALLVLVGALTDRAPTVLLAVLVPALVPIVYSYVIYRRLEGPSKDDEATEE
jgi:immunity protein, SdpI family